MIPEPLLYAQLKVLYSPNATIFNAMFTLILASLMMTVLMHGYPYGIKSLDTIDLS